MLDVGGYCEMYVFVSCARGAVPCFGHRSILCPCCHLIGAGTAHEQALLVDPPETWKVDQTDGSDHAEVDLPVAGTILGNESIVLQVREAGGILAKNARENARENVCGNIDTMQQR